MDRKFITLLEALILYAVIFLPGLSGSSWPLWNLSYLTVHIVPSMALLILIAYYHGYKDKLLALPQRNDLLSFLIALPALVLSGILVSSIPFDAPRPDTIVARDDMQSIIILCLSCIGGAYFEEMFFRFYLVGRLGKALNNTIAALLISVVLFTACHAYEGLHGMVNAAVSATILSFIFIRYRCIHGIALAHAGYNIIAYLLLLE
ncbi:MAG: CPBP family intramembrane metalloprotease [Spirochaetaceae bacterium]|nr:CPBP family intramembrane metalloprotease [Spirochaetaceae bacterium]